ncbi:MAG: hypothetical protein WD771_00705 [Gemmatimonadaceae bacterium]
MAPPSDSGDGRDLPRRDFVRLAGLGAGALIAPSVLAAGTTHAAPSARRRPPSESM